MSTSEVIDSAQALSSIDVGQRSVFRQALASSLIKNSDHMRVFEMLFELYFPVAPSEPNSSEASSREALIEALLAFDLEQLAASARAAVDEFAYMEPGRPVGGRYYQWKVEQALDLDRLRGELMERMGAAGSGEQGKGGFSSRIAGDEADSRIEALRSQISSVIRSRLVADRGPEAMARALVRPLPEEVEFLQASSEELADIRRAISALSRRLAARLAYKHHHANNGKIDFRATIRASLQTGGVPLDPRFRHRTQRPDLVVLCDLSGSVAAFSRFALALLYALSQHFRRVRSFGFIDTIDELSRFFERSDLTEATARIKTEADLVWLDGHSDYGHSFTEFLARYSDALSPKTTVLVLGDFRSNYRPAAEGVLAEVKERTRRLFLLNPEPRAYWDTGDSIVSTYLPVSHGVYECRNLRQLGTFIETLT